MTITFTTTIRQTSYCDTQLDDSDACWIVRCWKGASSPMLRVRRPRTFMLGIAHIVDMVKVPTAEPLRRHVLLRLSRSPKRSRPGSGKQPWFSSSYRWRLPFASNCDRLGPTVCTASARNRATASSKRR